MTPEITLATGVAGFAGYEFFKHYTSVAPSLAELRDAHGTDLDSRQKLLDADLMVGGLALLVGATASSLSKSWLPLLGTVVALCYVSGWHHWVLSSPATS